MTSFAPNTSQVAGHFVKKERASEYFSTISPITYEGPQSQNIMAFKYYKADEIIYGKTMKEWLRFSVCFWHTFRGAGADMFGAPTVKRPWDDGTNSVENAKRRLEVAFEFFTRLGVPYYTFHDRDIAPEGATLEETNKNLEEIAQHAKQLQDKTGVKLLWGTANLFAHPRYMNGAFTNPDVNVFIYAAAQVKKVLDVTNMLGGENFVFWGGREGYQTLLNTDTKKELDHYAQFLHMIAKYARDIKFNGQLLIEPKPREPTKHQYDYDAQTVIAFLKTYGLEKSFKLNIEPNHTTLAGHDYEHDLEIASQYNFLGSVDSNTGDPLVGWDTDQFLTDVKKATLVMEIIIKQGGLGKGGLNFDCKVRRESTDVEDMFIAHIGAMDVFARGLRNAERLLKTEILGKLKNERYSSWKSEIGQRIEKGNATIEDLANLALKNGEPEQHSGKQEKYEMLLNSIIQ